VVGFTIGSRGKVPGKTREKINKIIITTTTQEPKNESAHPPWATNWKSVVIFLSISTKELVLRD
jgi:hypothetical protein